MTPYNVKNIIYILKKHLIELCTFTLNLMFFQEYFLHCRVSLQEKLKMTTDHVSCEGFFPDELHPIESIEHTDFVV